MRTESSKETCGFSDKKGSLPCSGTEACMDKIIIEGMRFYGYHGVLAEEKALGQKFTVDAVLYLPLRKAGQSDSLEDTVNYAAVYDRIRDIVTGTPYNLLEALAERLCEEIFECSPLISRITLRLRKPEAPINGLFDSVGVEIDRDRL
jgi:dihydroneopterin aldolase